MPALFFPNLNTLRLALANGLVSTEISRSPAAAGFDDQGRLWLNPVESPNRESLAALAHIGVQVLGEIRIPTTLFSCWAELLPLLRCERFPNTTILFRVPDRKLAQFVARLRRGSQSSLAVSLSEDESTGSSWVIAAHPPVGVLAEALEADCYYEAFTEQASGVWVRYGWQHPLPDHLNKPASSLLLLRPPSSLSQIPDELPRISSDEWQLPTSGNHSKRTAATAPPIPVPLQVVPRATRHRESFWVLRGETQAEFWTYCTSIDERLLRSLQVALVGSENNERLLIRDVGNGVTAALPLHVNGYYADERLPGLYLPTGNILRPSLRVRELAKIVGTDASRLVWIEAGASREAVPFSVAAAAFHSVSELISYHVSGVNRLQAQPRTNPFPLAGFVVKHDPMPLLEPDPVVIDLAMDNTSFGSVESTAGEASWLLKSFRKLASKLRPHRDNHPQSHATDANGNTPERTPVGQRAERNLASPDALLHGHDWPARRRELETRLFEELPKLGPKGRASRWADLASAYTATGNAIDEAVSWINALWESTDPPRAWFDHWLSAEMRAAKLTDVAQGIERCLREPGRPGVGRVIAAYTASVGFLPSSPSNLVASLPRLLTFLDQHFDDIPVRAAWLARMAAARLCDGDALGLARWRDRVLARLEERGPGLDLDEPSFLRFHGTASADRFQTAREWLVRVSEPALSWVQRQGGGNLRWAGLDAESDCTSAYTRFMLAWGLGCLGERTRARDWATRAHKALSRATGPGVDPATHALLGDLFMLRVRDAQEGRAAKPGLPPQYRARLEALPELARFAVDRLREHSRILEPIDRVHAFRGLELKGFWGNDRLGDRLFVLASRCDPDQLTDEVDQLLRLCDEHPNTSTVPRVTLTLLELAPWLDRVSLLKLLDLLPTALDWLETWLANRKWGQGELAEQLLKYQTRLLNAGFVAAAIADSPSLASDLVRHLMSKGEALRAPLTNVAAQLFRTLRQLRQTGAAESLVSYLDLGDIGGITHASRLAIAAGWYVAGNEDVGNRILDEARTALFLGPEPNNRNRTALALAYANTLGFAPPRIAHGRLEEIFQRLGPIDVMGSTNRYFTLKPLQLIDTVIRSVVSDEFVIGSPVRSWLDDDEFLIRSRIHRDLGMVLQEQGIT